MLDGTDLLATGPEPLILAVWCAAIFFLALKTFTWRLAPTLDLPR